MRIRGDGRPGAPVAVLSARRGPGIGRAAGEPGRPEDSARGVNPVAGAKTRSRSRFVCQACGTEAPRWLGRCPGCGAYNTMAEEPEARRAALPALAGGQPPVPVTEVRAAPGGRLPSGWPELDRVLGGGLVPGSLLLVGGDPGIGKSTLLLQLADGVARRHGPVLYVSGEESAEQLRLRAERLGAVGSDLFVVAETDLTRIERYVESRPWRLVVVDSIQTVYRPELASAPGSVTQVRESAGHLLRLAKGRGVPTVLVGHVTKSEALAGPATLFHLVDAVFTFEGEAHQPHRLLRATKNRFGSTNELGVFEMGPRGLVEVENPSELFLAERPGEVAGSVVVASLEGSRPLLVEVQALVARTACGVPRRVATGVDLQRLALILAVLEQRAGLEAGQRDAYVKVAGGLRLEEPAADLGLAIALASSHLDRPARRDVAIAGEVGLAGEVRAVHRPLERLREAHRLGFSRFVLPAASLPALGREEPVPAGVELVAVRTVGEAIGAALTGGPGKEAGGD